MQENSPKSGEETQFLSDNEAVSLLLLEDAAELRRLAKSGWFKAAEAGWPLAELVQGHVRYLRYQRTVLTTDEVCGAFGWSKAQFKKLEHAGFLKRERPGAWSVIETIRGVMRYMRDEARRTTRTAADSRVRDARASEMEARTAERMRHLIPIDDAIAALDGYVGFVRTEFAGLPARCTRDLSWRRLIEDKVNDSFQRLATRCRKVGAALREDGDLVDAVTATEPGPVGTREPDLSTMDGHSGTA